MRVTSAGDARGSSGRAPDGETSDAGLVGDPEDAAAASSGQGSGDRRRVVVVVRGVSGLLGVVGVEAEDVIGDPLRFGRRMEDLAAVLPKHANPRLKVTRVIRNVARQSDHRSDRVLD